MPSMQSTAELFIFLDATVGDEGEEELESLSLVLLAVLQGLRALAPWLLGGAAFLPSSSYLLSEALACAQHRP